MRRNALAMGAAVLAAVPVVVSVAPITAASEYTLPGWAGDAVHTWCRWYYDEMPIIVDTAEYKALSLTSIDAFDRTNALVIAALYAGWKDAHPSDLAYMEVFPGYYLDPSGIKHSGAILGRARNFRMQNPEVAQIFVSDEVTFIIEPAGIFEYSGGNLYSVCYTPGGFTYNGAVYNWSRLYCSFRYGETIPTVDTAHLLDGGYFRTDTAPNKPLLSSGNRRSTFISGFSEVTAPLSDDDFRELATPAYEELVENYPELAPFVPDINTPPPTYPVQETWSNEADWPEGNLLPTIPAASYTVDIPEVMTEGVSFWWRCLGVLFDGLGITAVVVGLLALGIVLYFVLR